MTALKGIIFKPTFIIPTEISDPDIPIEPIVEPELKVELTNEISNITTSSEIKE